MTQNLEPSPDQALTVEIGLVDPPLQVRLNDLMLGRTLTHVLTQGEIDRDVVPMTPDFAAIWPMIGIPPYDRINGEPCESYFDEAQEHQEGALRLEPGALAAFSAGSLIGIRVADDGLHLGAATEADELTHLMLVSVFASEVGPAFADAPFLQPGDDDEVPLPIGSIPLEEFLQLVCLRHPEVFTSPAMPVADLLDDLDLDHDHGLIAPAGFDFDTEDQLLDAASELARVVETYEIDEEEAMAVISFSAKIDQVHDAIHEWTDENGDDDLPLPDLTDLLDQLDFLAEPMVAVAIADENLTHDGHLSVVLQLILTTLRAAVPRRASAGFSWLLGRCADVLGDVDVAEDEYQRALDIDADFYPSLRELATLASLRGDADRAASLLNRAGVPADDEELVMVSRYLGESRADLSRNGPCWCGSGKKYKKCHLGKSDHSVESRRDWLYEKVSRSIRYGIGQDLLIDLAAETVAPGAAPGAMELALANPLIMDVAIFEGGLLDYFLAGRGTVLPVDERDLLTSWADSRRTLVRVESVDEAIGFTGADVVTGDVIDVRSPLGTVDRSALGSHHLAVGDLVCLRLLPAGESLAAPGGLTIVLPEHRDLTLATLALQGTEDADPLRTVGVLHGAMHR